MAAETGECVVDGQNEVAEANESDGSSWQLQKEWEEMREQLNEKDKQLEEMDTQLVEKGKKLEKKKKEVQNMKKKLSKLTIPRTRICQAVEEENTFLLHVSMLGPKPSFTSSRVIGGASFRLKAWTQEVVRGGRHGESARRATALHLRLHCNDWVERRTAAVYAVATMEMTSRKPVPDGVGRPFFSSCCVFSRYVDVAKTSSAMLDMDFCMDPKNGFLHNGAFIIEGKIAVLFHYKNCIEDFSCPNPPLTDITLHVGGRDFHVNIVYLAHYAKYFKDYVTGDDAKKSEVLADLRGIDAEFFEEFLRVVYPERKKITRENEAGFHLLAGLFGLQMAKLDGMAAVVEDFYSADVPLSDFIVHVAGKDFHVNLVYMAHYCDYFKKLLGSDCVEKREGRIVLKNINSDEFEDFLRTIYPRRKEIEEPHACHLLSVADSLGAEPIRRECSEYIKMTDTLSPSEKLVIAEKHRLFDVQYALSGDDPETIIGTEDFDKLPEPLQKLLYEQFFNRTTRGSYPCRLPFEFADLDGAYCDCALDKFLTSDSE